jgi:hypothetical protein
MPRMTGMLLINVNHLVDSRINIFIKSDQASQMHVANLQLSNQITEDKRVADNFMPRTMGASQLQEANLNFPIARQLPPVSPLVNEMKLFEKLLPKISTCNLAIKLISKLVNSNIHISKLFSRVSW